MNNGRKEYVHCFETQESALVHMGFKSCLASLGFILG